MTLDATHDPAVQSWIESANDPLADFPIQNLPFGCFSRGEEPARVGIAIGDQVLDLEVMLDRGLLPALEDEDLLRHWSLNPLMSAGRDVARQVRRAVFDLLRDDAPSTVRAGLEDALVPIRDVRLHRPATIGDYTDFYASIHHATNVGRMFRPDNPLLPNYKWVPIGYHGRASSIVTSGTPVVRPSGQTKDEGDATPMVGPSRRMDYELEVGVFVGEGNDLGEPVALAEMERRLFGICLVNDWSARDIQSWEYQPLGPFLSKSFATSISPWVVTFDALEPFRAPRAARAAEDPAPLPYLDGSLDRDRGAIALTLEVHLSTARMRAEGVPPLRVSRGDFSGMYWTLAQLATHHASNGCNLRPGDLLASGTVSGPDETSHGCLLERTWRGSSPLALPTGEQRRFLEDGDEVILRGWCERDGARRIGLGECRGIVLPAR